MDGFKKIVNMLLDFHIEQLNKIGAEKESSIVELARCQYTIDHLGFFHSQLTNAIEIHFEGQELTELDKIMIKEAFGTFCFAGMPKIKYSELK
jgi:hypothetical protein